MFEDFYEKFTSQPFKAGEPYKSPILEKFYFKDIPSEELQKAGAVPFSISKMNCCGLRELRTTHLMTRFSKNSFLRWCKWMFCEDGDKEWGGYERYIRGGLLLMSLNSLKDSSFICTSQREKFKWAEEVGFKKLTSFKNYVHDGHELVLLSFQLPEDLSSWKWPSEIPLEVSEVLKEEKKKKKLTQMEGF